MAEVKDAREGGAWIGQHPDRNTEQIREELDAGAERVAVTNNEVGPSVDEESRPRGDGDGRDATGDEVRAGRNS